MRAHRSESEKLQRHLPHRVPSHIVMKIDTEGAEYVLLPHLLSRGVLCAANLIFLEWHPTTQANGRPSPTPEQQRVNRDANLNELHTLYVMVGTELNA
jgi:hypothetical protein